MPLRLERAAVASAGIRADTPSPAPDLGILVVQRVSSPPTEDGVAPMTPSSNGHYVSMVAHTGAYVGPFETPRDPSLLGLKGLMVWWDSLMFMTADARVRSNWVTFKSSSASSSG
jgi:hypothetical protein